MKKESRGGEKRQLQRYVCSEVGTDTADGARKCERVLCDWQVIISKGRTRIVGQRHWETYSVTGGFEKSVSFVCQA